MRFVRLDARAPGGRDRSQTRCAAPRLKFQRTPNRQCRCSRVLEPASCAPHQSGPAYTGWTAAALPARPAAPRAARMGARPAGPASGRLRPASCGSGHAPLLPLRCAPPPASLLRAASGLSCAQLAEAPPVRRAMPHRFHHLLRSAPASQRTRRAHRSGRATLTTRPVTPAAQRPPADLSKR